MNHRITSFAIGSRAIQFSNRHNLEIFKYQQQISSGQRIHAPSDDPTGYRHVTSLSSRLTELTADQQSLNSAKSIISASVVQIQEFGNIFSAARVIAQQGIQANGPSEREALALEVDGLLTQLKDLSQATFDGNFLFSGTKSDARPFTFTEAEFTGETIGVTYSGSQENSRAYVGESVSVDTYYAGQELFENKNRQPTVVYGKTGVQSGPGTDTLVGKAQLLVSHVSTTYFGGSGIQPGTDSTRLDNVIGEIGRHQVTIVDTVGDGSAGTISINEGPAVPFTSGDDNLRVEGLSGEVIYVDTTSITAGFNGTVDLQGDGTVSVDGGVTQTAIDFSTDQVVTDSRSGRFAIIDTSGAHSAGESYLEFPGTSNAFQLLFDLSTDLRNNRDLDNSQFAEALDRRLGQLKEMSDHAFDTLGEQSTSLAALDRLEIRIQDLEIAVETQLTDIQATDIPEAVLRLENSRALLQYTYAVTAQISSIGLLEFLR